MMTDVKWDKHTFNHQEKLEQLLDLFRESIGLTEDEFLGVKSGLTETGLLPESTGDNAAHQIACLVRQKAKLGLLRESCSIMVQQLSEVIHGFNVLANWASVNLFLPYKEIDWESLDMGMESLAPIPPDPPTEATDDDDKPPRGNGGFGRRL